MDAPFLPNTKWFNYCHRLTELAPQEFEKQIPDALATLNSKVFSVYAEYRQDSHSFDRELLVLRGRIYLLRSDLGPDFERFISIMNVMGKNQPVSTSATSELIERIKQAESSQGPHRANDLFRWILSHFHEVAHYIVNTPYLHQITKLMERSYGELKLERQHGGFGPNLRRLARKLNQIAPGSVNEMVSKYDERTCSIKFGDAVVRVSSMILRRLQRDCSSLEEENKTDYVLPGSVNMQAFKYLLHYYEPNIYRERNVDRADMVRLGVILENKLLTDRYLTDLMCGLFASFNEEDPIKAKEYFEKYLLLRKLAAEIKTPYIQAKVDKLENDLREVSRFAVITTDFSRYVQNELPESAAHKLLEAIHVVIEKEKRDRGVMNFSASADRAIKTLKIWLQLSIRLQVEISSENPVAMLIEEVLLNPHRKQEIPSKMKQLKDAFPEFMIKHKEAVSAEEDFCEFSKEEAWSLPLKLDLSAIEEFKTEELQHLAGLNITEIRFKKQTQAVKDLMNLLPLAKFTFEIEPLPEKEPSEFEKGFKRFLSGF